MKIENQQQEETNEQEQQVNVSQETNEQGQQTFPVTQESEPQQSSEQEQSSKKDVKQDDVDEFGVPWKNRVAEMRRKIDKLTRDFDTYKSQSQSQTQFSNQSVVNNSGGVVEEDEFLKQQRLIAREEFNREKQADRVMNDIISNLEAENEEFRNVRGDILRELDGLSINLRTSPDAIRRVAYSVYGSYHIEQKKNKKPQTTFKKIENKSQVADINDVMPTTRSVSTGDSGKLTQEELEFADNKNLFGHGFNTKEIKEMYRERMEKKKK